MTFRTRPIFLIQFINSFFQSNLKFCISSRWSGCLHREFYSTPDLRMHQAQLKFLAPKIHRSQEDVNTINFRNSSKSALPNPSLPPSQISLIDDSATIYDNMAHIRQIKGTK